MKAQLRLGTVILGFAVLGSSGVSAQVTTTGFTQAYELDSWTKTEINEGTTQFFGTSTDGQGVTQTAEFRYNVSRAGGGVTSRTADFTMTIPTNAIITFDWTFGGNHRWFMAFAEFHVIVNGQEVASPVDRQSTSGVFNFAGGGQTVTVSAGDVLGFRIGGENFDSTSFLDGVLTINNFQVEATANADLDPELVISTNTTNPGTFDFSWASQVGRAYDIRSSEDLSIPMENWPVWNGIENLPATGDEMQIEAVASADTKRFFVVVAKPAP